MQSHVFLEKIMWRAKSAHARLSLELYSSNLAMVPKIRTYEVRRLHEFEKGLDPVGPRAPNTGVEVAPML